jgi:WD40 repeat protein
MSMARKHWPLLIQLLLFLLVTLLSIATGIMTNNPDALPGALGFLRRGALPLVGATVLLIIGVMIWQHRTTERLALPADPLWDRDRSPFPGLEAFTEQDSAVFFGRDAEIAELLERLHPVVTGQANRLVTVIGPSGAGKSSLVQAGVVPRLRQRRGGWIIAPAVLPSDHPLRSLTRSLAAACPGRPTVDMSAPQFTDELRAAHRRPHAPVLLIVDQAEELITLSGRTERDAFLGLLASALDADPQLWIILIMRTEFLNAFLGTEQARLFRDPVAVGTLGRAALVEVIEQPARQAGLAFDPPTLPQTMAAEAGGGDALPLLAYALQELCLTAGPGKPLTAEAYRCIGGVTGVLTHQADKVAAELGGADGPVLTTLLKFVTISENEPTRRRVQRNALTDAGRRVAEAFIAARLLTSTADDGDAILEVAHEALFRSWAPLRQAIEASTEQLRWRADLERWARDWESSGRQDAYLLRDERLKTAQRWAASDGAVVDGLPLVAEFLTCSNRADRATMEHLSVTIARQALGAIDRDPHYSLLLALAAFEECARTAPALRALVAALNASHLRAVLNGHSDDATGVAWSPDGRRLATSSNDRTVRIWDTNYGSELAVLNGHEGWVTGVAWSPEGQRLATVSGDCTARIWDAENGNGLIALRGHNDDVLDVAWSPDGERLATASRDRTARIWDTDHGAELTTLHEHEDWVRGVAWSPDSRRLATASSDRTARIWDAENGSELIALRGHSDEVGDVAWSPDGKRLATASNDATARIWNSTSAATLGVLRGHGAWVPRVAWSPNGRRLATASYDRTARIWDAPENGELSALFGHAGRVLAVAWSPGGGRLATGASDHTARLWDARSTAELTVLHGHEGWVQGVAWSPDGRRLATGSSDCTARIWDTDNGSELAVLHGHENWIRGVAWSPDGRRLATASSDPTVRLWDTDSGSELAVLRGHDDEVWDVSWSPDGRQLATASRDGTGRIWDTDNGSELTVLRGHNDGIRCVKWSPDGRSLATGSIDHTARIWDIASGSELLVLCGHDNAVCGMAWSPDSRRVVTASSDQTVRIWDAESGAEIIIGVHAEGDESVAWSPDGKRVAAGSYNGIVRILDATISVEDLVANAHHRIYRKLDAEERRNLMLPPIDSCNHADG